MSGAWHSKSCECELVSWGHELSCPLTSDTKGHGGNKLNLIEDGQDHRFLRELTWMELIMMYGTLASPGGFGKFIGFEQNHRGERLELKLRVAFIY